MKAPVNTSRPASWMTLTLVLLSAPLSTPAAPTALATNTVPAPEIPKSVFVVPTSAKEGRDPFFPPSRPAPPSPEPDKVAPVTFVLNGITSPPKRTAMINGRTFEVGEEGEVKVQGGAKVLIRCLEIRNDSAVISAAGQRRELRFRSSL